MKIYKARTSWADSFPELLSMWQESGYCEIIQTEGKFTWANEVGDALLHEHDRVSELPKWNVALFANQIHESQDASPWIYWARHPRNLENVIDEGILNFDERDIESIFLGKVENPIQGEARTKYDWSTCVKEFSMPIEMWRPGNYKLSNIDYLKKIKRSKFGLCLPGYGPKCQREIELMGLGVVPIVTPNVNTEYYDSLRKDVHYLYAEDPTQVSDVISSCSRNKWLQMSRNCVDWYFRNCSREGSFEATRYIIDELKERKKT